MRYPERMKPYLKRAYKEVLKAAVKAAITPEMLAEFRRLGSLGGKKGGRAGGLARAKNLSPAERKAIGRKAAEARWGKATKVPRKKKPR